MTPASFFAEFPHVEREPGRFVARVPAPTGSLLPGGFLLAEAVTAASTTVDDGAVVHALHGRFPQGGVIDEEVEIVVETVRDGRSFASRLVRVVQQDRILLLADVSFRAAVPTGAPDGAHDDAPGSAPGARAWSRAPSPGLGVEPEAAPVGTPVASFPAFARHFDVRAGTDDTTTGRAQTFHPFWIRHRGGLPDDPHLHAAALAYVTDVGMSGSALPPDTRLGDRFGSVTLDHAVWFHRPCRLDDWLHVSVEPMAMGDHRVFARGEIRARDGVIVASTAQEAWLGNRVRREDTV